MRKGEGYEDRGHLRSNQGPIEDYDTLQAWLRVEKEAKMIEMKYQGNQTGKEFSDIEIMTKGFKNRQKNLKDLSDKTKQDVLKPMMSKPPKTKSRNPEKSKKQNFLKESREVRRRPSVDSIARKYELNKIKVSIC